MADGTQSRPIAANARRCNRGTAEKLAQGLDALAGFAGQQAAAGLKQDPPHPVKIAIELRHRDVEPVCRTQSLQGILAALLMRRVRNEDLGDRAERLGMDRTRSQTEQAQSGRADQGSNVGWNQ